MQNQPDPDTPVDERRWLDRLRAAWDEVRARPANRSKAAALEAVGQERPKEAKYRVGTFAADAARRTSPTPAGSRKSLADTDGMKPTYRAGTRRQNLTASTTRPDNERARAITEREPAAVHGTRETPTSTWCENGRRGGLSLMRPARTVGTGNALWPACRISGSEKPSSVARPARPAAVVSAGSAMVRPGAPGRC